MPLYVLHYATINAEGRLSIDCQGPFPTKEAARQQQTTLITTLQATTISQPTKYKNTTAPSTASPIPVYRLNCSRILLMLVYRTQHHIQFLHLFTICIDKEIRKL